MFRKIVLSILFFLLCVISVSAVNVTQEADRINYWDNEQHTVTVTNSCGTDTQVNITIAGSFTYDSGTCSQSGSIITCDIPASSSRNYVVNSSSADSEYKLSKFVAVTNNSCTVNDVSFLKIRDDEVFHTLVEYGRGRGNYFFDTYGGGLYATTGHTGTGCSYLPNGTMFELNYLHKVNNVKQYFGNMTAEAYNVSFSCIYPNSSVVRTHLISSITTNNSGAYVSYLIPRVEGSWERMGYLGMDFNPVYSIGQNITISCTNITYKFPLAGGNFVVDNDSFTLQIRNREPFTATASTTSTIGNGTQEVIITYNITNNELYNLDDVIIEIQAPPYAEFIGTRGELWGAALDQYRIEKMYLAPGESEIIELVARFNTSNAPNISTLDLTSGIKIKYVTCWDLNAYNPMESMQRLYNVGNVTVNMGIPSEIIGVRETIEEIFNTLIIINSTTININNTVNNIESVVSIINSTTIDTNIIVNQINNTVNYIINNITVILDNTNSIISNTATIKDLLNCNGSIDTPICDELNIINSTISNITNVLIEINNTLNNITINVTIDLSGENITVNVTANLTNITLIIDDIMSELNCSNVTGMPETDICVRLIRIQNNTIIINNTINTINDLVNYFNATVFGNVTLKEIYEAISNTTVDTSELLKIIRQMKEFDEELVFLVTDSFGLQQQAREELDKGNVGEAATKLREANSRLNEAAVRLMQLQSQEAAGVQESERENSTLIISLLLVAMALVITIYLIARPPANKQKKQMIDEIKAAKDSEMGEEDNKK